MAKAIETSAAVEPGGRQDAPTRKTTTNWGAFEKAKLVPKEVICDGYRPYHRVDLSCHTRLQPDAKVLGAHVKAEHGGGFVFTLRKADAVWPGWRKFEEAGLESRDFRCDVCDEVIPFHPGHILKHMKPHSGKSKRIIPGGRYNLTLGFGLGDPTAEEAFEGEWKD